MNRWFFALMMGIALSLGCTPKRSSILIIGDSISMGYTPFVTNMLKAKADVVHNPGNAQHTGTGLEKVEEWIGQRDWDIIQFNWGLWDLCYRHPNSKVQGNRDKVNGQITWSIDQYAANLDSIVRLLQAKTTADLIFVTTTYVPENEAGRFMKDVEKYNGVAKEIMKKYSVTVNDIFEESISIHQTFGKGNDDVHYVEEGYQRLGQKVTNFLLAEIESLKVQ